MFVCQWSLDVVYWKKKEALQVMKAWGAEKMKSSAFRKSKNRVMDGFIGASSAHIVDEYLFETLADFEEAIADMKQQQFKPFSDALAPFIVPGTQRWTVFKLIE